MTAVAAKAPEQVKKFSRPMLTAASATTTRTRPAAGSRPPGLARDAPIR
jgi:hypothetical protein